MKLITSKVIKIDLTEKEYEEFEELEEWYFKKKREYENEFEKKLEAEFPDKMSRFKKLSKKRKIVEIDDRGLYAGH